jgi:hypothetical protein
VGNPHPNPLPEYREREQERDVTKIERYTLALGKSRVARLKALHPHGMPAIQLYDFRPIPHREYAFEAIQQ